MTVNGIIAEYNPFHKGHQYHLDTSAGLTGADYTIVVMSGSFTQRGEPAVTDKFTRTKIALESGAHLVIELPVAYATASAEAFAFGGVSLLHHLGVVDYLCFGSETADLDSLTQIARLLASEPPILSQQIRENLKCGMTYPAARQKALISHLPSVETAKTMSTPNNLLGIEYLKALYQLNSPITPCPLKRLAAGYHDMSATNGIASAGGIRHILEVSNTFSEITPYLTDPGANILETYFSEYKPVYPSDFSELLYYKLILEKHTGYTAYLDVTTDLSNRIVACLDQYQDYDQFVKLLGTRNYTCTRIKRCLLHILLNIKQLPPICYARVLGFRADAGPVLSQIKKKTKIPLISKLADAGHLLNEEAFSFLCEELLQNEIYEGILSHKCHKVPRNESRIPIVIVK